MLQENFIRPQPGVFLAHSPGDLWGRARAQDAVRCATRSLDRLVFSIFDFAHLTVLVVACSQQVPIALTRGTGNPLLDNTQ